MLIPTTCIIPAWIMTVCYPSPLRKRDSREHSLAPAGTQIKHTDSLKLTPKVVSASPMAESLAWVMLPPTDVRWACQQQCQEQGAPCHFCFLSSSQSSGQSMCQKLCVRLSAAFRKTNVNSPVSNVRSHCQNRL